MKRNLPAIPDNSLEHNIRWWAAILNYNEIFEKAMKGMQEAIGIPKEFFTIDILESERSSRKFKWKNQK